MWTAQIVNKSWKNGLLTVELEYTDGVRMFRDSMVSRSGQTADWVQAQVTRRLADLASLDALAESIEIGTVVSVAPKGADTPLSTYAAQLRTFNGWLSALRQGVVTVERAEFVAVRQWLRDNWRDEYVELFLR